MLHEIERELGLRIRWLRKTRGLTQQGLAARCGVSYQQVQKYETAKCRLSAAMLWQIARALRVEPEFFYSGVTAARPAQKAGETAPASPQP